MCEFDGCVGCVNCSRSLETTLGKCSMCTVFKGLAEAKQQIMSLSIIRKEKVKEDVGNVHN